MAYHEALWVTFTAAAPVLALTYVTSLGRTAKIDDDAISLGIWSDVFGVSRMFGISVLGILMCTTAFIWGLLALAKQSDLGPLIIPLSLVILAFLMIFLLTVFEMRSRKTLGEQRVLGKVFERNPYIPDRLQTSARVAEINHQVYWPVEDAPEVIRTIAGAGHVVHRIYIREHPGYAFSDVPITIPNPIDTPKPIDATAQAAIDAIVDAGNKTSSPDAVIRIVWS